eukprot:scpid100899/ scgid18015/ 
MALEVAVLSFTCKFGSGGLMRRKLASADNGLNWLLLRCGRGPVSEVLVVRWSWRRDVALLVSSGATTTFSAWTSEVTSGSNTTGLVSDKIPSSSFSLCCDTCTSALEKRLFFPSLRRVFFRECTE